MTSQFGVTKEKLNLWRLKAHRTSAGMFSSGLGLPAASESQGKAKLPQRRGTDLTMVCLCQPSIIFASRDPALTTGEDVFGEE